MEAVGKILYLLFGNFRRLFFADLCNRGAVSSALAAAGADAGFSVDIRMGAGQAALAFRCTRPEIMCM